MRFGIIAQIGIEFSFRFPCFGGSYHEAETCPCIYTDTGVSLGV